MFCARASSLLMTEVSLRQIRAVVAVCEEGSFTRAAERENATQSGISQHIASLERDREMLVSGRARGLKPLAPVRLVDCAPLKIVAPGPPNIRRRNIDTYFQTNGVPVEDMIEMDAMIGTLEFVAATDWVAILPG